MIHDNDGIVRCPRCKRDFIAEEMESHGCLASVKQIPVVYFFTVNNQREEIVIAKGYDGVLYRLIKSPRHKPTPTDSQQRKETPDKDDRTIIIIIIIIDVMTIFYTRLAGGSCTDINKLWLRSRAKPFQITDRR